MADSACYIELASNNGDFFTNSLTDDIMIRPQYATQKILIGTSNGQVPSLTVTSNNVGVGTTTPSYKLDVAGYSRLSENYTFMDDVPFGNTSTNRRYALLATLSYGNSFMRITGIAGGHDSGLSAQGKCKYDIIIDNRNVHIRGTVSNFFLNSGTGIVVYRDNSTNAFTVYLTGQNYYRHNIQVQNAAGSVQTSLSWSTDTAWTTPTGTTLWLDTMSMIPANCLGTEFYMSSAATPVYGITTLNSGNVGIGASNPSSSLHVVGKALITSNTQANTDAIIDIRHTNNIQAIGIGYNTINATGTNTDQDININPKGAGDVKMNTSTGYLKVTKGSGLVTIGSSNTSGGGFVAVANGDNMYIADSNWPYYGIGCSPTGIVNIQGYYGLSLGVSASTLMTLSNNNVGIGTTSPAYKLDVAGQANITYTGASASFTVSNNSSPYTQLIGMSNSVLTLGASGAAGIHSTDTIAGDVVIKNQQLTSTGRLMLQAGNGSSAICINSNNTVGIGTTNPAKGKFEVNGVISTNQNGEARYHLFNNGGVAEWKLGQKSSTSHSLIVSKSVNNVDSDYLTIDTSGNVGVGTTSPLYTLDVNGTLRATNGMTLGQDFTLLSNNSAWSTKAGRQIYMRYSTLTGQDAGYIQCIDRSISTYYNLGIEASNIALGGQTSLVSPTIYAQYGGNVGIGTASPSYKLDVSGDIRASGEIISTSTNNFRMVQGNYGIFGRNDGTDYYTMLTNSGSPYGVYNSLRPFRINLASGAVYIGDTSLYVANAGNVGIGTTSPTAKLHINSGALMVTQCNTGTAYIGSTSNGGAFISLAQSANMLNASSNWPYYGMGISDGAMLNIQGFYGVRLGDRDNIGTIALSNNNVGIGNTNPLYKLDVNGTTRINNVTAIYGGNSAGGGALLSLRNTATANDPRWIFRGPDWGANAGLFIGYNECNDTSFNSGVNGGNPALSIRSVSGYYAVGIGTSANTSFGLQVNGTYAPFGNIASFMYSNITTLIGAGDVATRYNGLVKQGDSLIVGFSNAVNTGGLVLGTWSGGMSGIRVDGPTGYVGVGSSNPAYKLDVAGDIIARNAWIRTTGNSGWYNETHGGGFYMTDTTWIRTYNAKNFFHDGSIMRTDGQFHVGEGGSTFLCSNGGNFAYRTNVLFANTSGNVGIGTSNPSYRLDVNGTINATSYSNVNYFYLTNQPSQVWRSDFLGTSINALGYFKIATLADISNGANGTGVNIRGWAGAFGPKMNFECMVSTRGGVNMKAYTSGAIYDSATDVMLYQESNNTFSLYFWNNSYYATWWFEVSTNTSYGATLLTPSATRTTPTGTLNTSMSSNLVTVASGTNFGIGLSNPSYKLDVAGTTHLGVYAPVTGPSTYRSLVLTPFSNASYSCEISLEPLAQAGSNNVRSWMYSDSNGVSLGSTNNLYLQSSNSTIVSIVGSNVGISTTSPSYKLHVVGDVYATGDIIGFSDARLKSNITIIDDALTKIHKINGYTYNLPNDEKTHTGLIAQEVIEVLPEAVHRENKNDGTEGHYSLAYGNMAGLLVEAIKEIDNKYKSLVNDLHEQISILMNEIDILKNKS